MVRFKRKKNLIKAFLLYTITLVIVYLIGIVFVFLLNMFNGEKVESSKVTPLKAFNRAMNIINYRWTYEKKNLDESIILPYYINEQNEYIGLPYCYGGQISIDSSNIQGISNFKDALKKGYYPGNINTKLGYIKNTAGVDCSGFVAAVFDIKESISTATMDKYFKKIDFKDIKPMDIINSKGRHVYIYLGMSRNNNGIIILESTSNGDKKYKDKTVVNFKSIKELNKDFNEKNFIAMRYIGVKGKNIDYVFDQYEYNNEERFSNEITLNSKIEGNIDYLEDVDYFHISYLSNKSFIDVSKISTNQEIVIYNNENEMKINKQGKYEINLTGKVYIKVHNVGKVLDEKKYILQVFSK